MTRMERPIDWNDVPVVVLVEAWEMTGKTFLIEDGYVTF